MQKIFKIRQLVFLFATVLLISNCKKQEYSFGDILTPSNVTINTTIQGISTSLPNGDGSGAVQFHLTADNAISYKVDYGDGNTPEMVATGDTLHKYTTVGTSDYSVTVTAIGKGGIMSTTTKTITVYVVFDLPEYIMTDLTGGSSKKWGIDHDAAGHFGVGPIGTFYPDWYTAAPNEKESCAYDDIITFTKSGNNITMTIDNKGTSFLTAAGTAYYGFSGADGCYPVKTGDTQLLAFMNATSGSTADQSTQVQFKVPGNGIVDFGTGGNTYEIISITETSLFIRNVGSDGNAWYQKFKAL